MTAFLGIVFILLGSIFPPLPYTVEIIKGKKHVIYWTIDDHPNCTHTDVFLKTLKKNRIKATFFVNAKRVWHHQNINNRWLPGLVALADIENMHKQGHTLGNHSLSHQNMCQLDNLEMRREIYLNAQAVRYAAGVTMNYWRPPYGVTCKRLRKEVRRARLKTLWWHIDDYTLTLKQMKSKLLERVKKGHKKSILLFHCFPKKFRAFVNWVKSRP